MRATPTLHRSVRLRLSRATAVLLLLITSLVWGTVVGAPAADAADVGMSKPVYGANEAVIIDIGMTDYVRNCTQQPGAAVPVNDWLYGVSDIYVVKSTWDGGDLVDVSGEPNVVFGQIGGAFVDEVIGYTAPGGNLKPGRYGIVIDNCQDKHFDPAVDTFIPDAFRVTSQVLAPAIDIAAIKADARVRSDSWMDAEYTFTGLMFAANVYEIYGAVTDPLDGLIFMIQDAFVRAAGLPDAKAEARNLLLSTARHWGGIAADPPNHAYDVPVGPGLVPTLESQDANAMLRAQVALAQQSAIEGDLAKALLDSVEKYQGAAIDRNGVWARQHARAAQRYAQALAAQLPETAAAASDAAAAVRATPAGLDTLMDTIGTELIDARSNGISQEVRTKAAALGMTPAELQSGLRTVDLMNLSGITRAGAASTLDDIAAQTATLTAELSNLVATFDSIVDQLDADPMMTTDFVHAEAGGPYSAATGETVSLDATGSTGSGTLSYAWDLDGDGAYDDATGATPSFTVTSTTPALLSVKATDGDGLADIAVATFTNTTTDPAPTITGRTPSAGVVDLVGGASELFTITASDPGGGAVTTAWHVNGTLVANSASYTLATLSSEVGGKIVTAVVTDDAGHKTSTTWWVRISGADEDGDGWPIPLDCNDADASVNPGMPDIANGVDDDCDPATSDGTPVPAVTADVHTDPVGSAEPPPAGADGLEGTEMLANGTIDTSGSGNVTRRIDWGDGTVATDTVTRAQFTSKVLRHTYVDDGVYPVELCGRYATSPWGCTYQTVTIANQTPKVNFVDLTTWMALDHPIIESQGNASWEVAETRDSVLQTRNSDPSVFLSPDSFIDTEATVELTVETYSDDDFIGFVIGGTPDMLASADAHYLVVDWKQGNQDIAKRGLSVSEVHGNDVDYWGHRTPTGASGSWAELQRGATLGDVGWSDYVTYAMKFRYTPDRLQVWVNDVLELDVTGDFPPSGRFGFYNFSQDGVRYRNFAQSAAIVDEGTTTPFNGYFFDPGVLDTHTGLFEWGDGSASERVSIDTTSGAGTATARHRYLDDGSFLSRLCVTDNAGGTGCHDRQVQVRNVAPVVEAGRDRVAGPDVVLDDSVFTDVGIADTHTATVDWGDGSPLEDVAVSEDRGSGIVSAVHRYDTDGPMTVTVCVTDDDGDTACDSFVATVRATNGMLTATGEPDVTVDEGDLVARQVAFEDENPTDRHTGTISWGDGTSGPMTVQDGGAVGVGSAVHRYGDNGVYTVTGQVCDDRGVCTTSRSTVTVRNVAPTLTATGDDPVEAGQIWGMEGTWADVGVDDTHVVAVDWGDGTTSQFPPSVSAPGSGRFDGTHVFAEAGTYEVRVCVVDDDEGSGCTTVEAVVAEAPPTTTPPTTPGTVPTTVAPVGTNPTSVTPTSISPTPMTSPLPVVTPSETIPEALPRTGANPLPAALLGLCALVSGGLVLLAERRTRRTRLR